MPVLDRLIPEGIPYGRTVIVEFDPDSVWYPLAVNMIAKCLKSQVGADYHAFSNHPDDIRANLSKLGIDARQDEESGLLWIIDFYSPGIGVQSKEKWTVSSLKLTDIGIDRRRRHQVQRQCLHVDDNFSIVFDQNEAKDVVQFLRSKILPGTRESQRIQLLGLMRGVHSEYVYRSLEDAAYGVVDIRTQEAAGKPESFVRVRSMKAGTHDGAWHQLTLGPDFQIALQ